MYVKEYKKDKILKNKLKRYETDKLCIKALDSDITRRFLIEDAEDEYYENSDHEEDIYSDVVSQS